MIEQVLTPLEASVQTGDSSNLVLWIVVGAVAVVLIVVSAVLSVMGKKKNEDQGKQDKTDE